MIVLLLLLAALVFGGGCTAIVDADRFQVEGGDGPVTACRGDRRSLRGTFVNFDEFDERRIEMLVVETATGRAEQRAVLEGLHPVHDLGGESFSVNAACMIPGPGYELRMFVDEDENGVYTRPGTDAGDPAYVVPIADSGAVTVDADRSPQTDISEGLDVRNLASLTLIVSGMTAHTPGTQRFDMHVLDVTDGEGPGERFVQGVFRIGDIEEADFEVVMVNSLVPERRYRLEFYADVDDDGVYDDPPVDHSWREPGPIQGEIVASLPGIVRRFTHTTNFDPLSSF